MPDTSNRIISVIIVTCGKRDYLLACLDSLAHQLYKGLEIILIDNSRSTALENEISRLYPQVRILLSEENLFYAQALNRGIQASCGEFILCLNDDVTLDKEYIQQAIRGFFLDDKIGMVSGKIFRSDGKTIDSTGLFLSYCYSAKERGYGKKDTLQFEKEEYVFGVNGAVAFYRKAMLEEIKSGSQYFDAQFNIFYEDLDVAWRAQRLGWKGYYIPAAIAYHVRGGSVREDYGINKPYAIRFLSADRQLDLLKNRYLAMIKNEDILHFILRLPGFIFYELMLWGYIVILRPKLVLRFATRLKYFKKACAQRKSSKNK